MKNYGSFEHRVETPFCVFQYIIETQVFYVGAGTLAEAFDVERRWPGQAARNGRPMRIVIRSVHETAETAREEAERLYALLVVPPQAVSPPRPVKLRSEPRKEIVMRLDTGDTYDTAATAAIATRVSKGGVSNSLTGRVPVIAGMQFVRIPWDGKPYWSQLRKAEQIYQKMLAEGPGEIPTVALETPRR